MTRPANNAPSSTWTWYVSAGETIADRQERLREVPEEIREEVETRVRRFWRHNSKPGAHS